MTHSLNLSTALLVPLSSLSIFHLPSSIFHLPSSFRYSSLPQEADLNSGAPRTSTSPNLANPPAARRSPTRPAQPGPSRSSAAAAGAGAGAVVGAATAGAGGGGGGGEQRSIPPSTSGTVGRRKPGAGPHIVHPSSSSAGDTASTSAVASSTPSQQYDPTSHPSLAAWQRFFARHQGLHPLANSRKPESGKPGAGPKSKGGAGEVPAKTTQVTYLGSEAAHEEAMRRLRKMILTHGIPGDEFPTPTGSTYRSVTWKLLLEVRSVSADSYLSLVRNGRSAAYDKIRNDTFRTLATDQGFKRRVHEDKLIRLLNAFVWKHADEHNEDEPPSSHYDFSYVQGMNVLAAPFLYVMPSELEAFHCFSRFIEVCCPLYVQPTLAGVHQGLRLLDICLELADPHLYNYLRSKNLSAEIYAFPSVLTLCACTPPLDQVLQLWDFLLAFGVHLNVLCVVSQLLLMRDDLMHNPSPMRLLRNFPPLEAQPIIGITVTLVRDLPDSLYEELVNHTFDPRAMA